LEALESLDDRVEALPVACRLPCPAVDDQLLWLLGDLRIEVVLEHPQSCLGHPVAATKVAPPGGANRAGRSQRRHAKSIAVRFAGIGHARGLRRPKCWGEIGG